MISVIASCEDWELERWAKLPDITLQCLDVTLTGKLVSEVEGDDGHIDIASQINMSMCPQIIRIENKVIEKITRGSMLKVAVYKSTEPAEILNFEEGAANPTI